VTYNVAAAPAISLARPEDGAVYVRGQSVSSSFLCAEGTGGPGLTSCVDPSGRGAGAPVDTATLGTHTLTVTATSADGLATTARSTYTVVRGASISGVRIHRSFITFSITLPSRGAVDAVATASPNGSRRMIVYGRSDIIALGSGKVPMIVIPGQRGKQLLRHHGATTVKLVVGYTANHAPVQTVATLFLKLTR
jgi:hypothetical protein